MDAEDKETPQEPEEADPSEYTMHEGKKYRLVAIDGQEGLFYMDEKKHIYTEEFEKIGDATDDSD